MDINALRFESTLRARVYDDAQMSASVTGATDNSAIQQTADHSVMSQLSLTQRANADGARGKSKGVSTPTLTAPALNAEAAVSAAQMCTVAETVAQGSDPVAKAYFSTLLNASAQAGASSAVAGAEGTDSGSGYVNDETEVDILLLMSQQWQKSQLADRELQGEMTTLASQSALQQSESQVAAGNDALEAAVGSSVLNVGMQVTGAVVKVGALNEEHDSLQINEQNAIDSTQRANVISGAVRSAETVGLSETNSVTVGTGGNQRTLHLEEDSRLPRARDAALMSESATESSGRGGRLSNEHRLNQKSWGARHVKGDLWRTGGDVSGRMVDGVGQMAQSKERAKQTVDQNAQEVSRSNASLHEESARQSRAIAQQMHTIANQLISNLSAVAGQVASNLRA